MATFRYYRICMTTTNMIAAPRFTRTDRTDRTDRTSEILTLVRLTSGARVDHGFVCADLDGARYPYLVQITTGTEPGDDFVGLYDLDGEAIDVGNAEWEIVTEAPAEVIEQIETSWESGSNEVVRI